MNLQALVPLHKAYTSGTAIAAVLMLRTVHKGCTCLLVEGPDDLKLFRKLTAETCVVIPAGNRTQVIDALEKVEVRGINGIAGVVDRDYSELNPAENLPASALLTGENDVELMLMSSDALKTALEEVLVHVPEVVVDGESEVRLLDWLLTRVALVGTFRAASRHKQLGLNFKGLKLRNVLKNGSPEIDEDMLLNELIKRTNNALSAEDIRAAVKEMNLAGMPLEKVCQGHDAVYFLLVAVNAEVLGQTLCEVSAVEFGRLLRASYSAEAFRQSELCKNFSAWDAGSAPYRLLAS